MSAQSDQFADAAAAIAQGVADATNDPADAIRLLLPLTSWVPEPVPGTSALAARTNAAAAAIADTLRCAACAALGAATQRYLPQSYQDAQALRKAVCDALDAQTICSADAGRDATYQALRQLRTFVAMDLAIRGANLAYLVEVSTAVSIPSLAEAWTLYQDTTREPSLAAASGVRHPLFMPLSFPALSR